MSKEKNSSFNNNDFLTMILNTCSWEVSSLEKYNEGCSSELVFIRVKIILLFHVTILFKVVGELNQKSLQYNKIIPSLL